MWNIIDHLPTASFLGEAMANDEEMAMAMPTPSGDAHRRMSQWDPSVELLTAILDTLGVLVRVGVASGGGHPPEIPPAPRPVTAFQTVGKQRRRLDHKEFMDRITQ